MTAIWPLPDPEKMETMENHRFWIEP